MRRRIPWLAIVVFALTTFALMPRPLLGMATFGAVDMLEQSTPYRESLDRRPDVGSWFQTDQVEGFPEKISFWNDLRDGRFQSWTHWVAGGTPTGVFPFNAILSPFSLGFVLFPAWYALTLSAALALVVAQAGTYLFLRRLSVQAPVAILGAVAYAFAGANVVNLHRVTAPLVMPLLLWAVDRLVGRPSWPRAATTALVLAWTWLEGFPFAFVVCSGTAVAWGLWRSARQWWRARTDRPIREPCRRAATLLGATAWGLAIAAFSIGPTLWEISRRGTLDIRDYTTAHLPPLQLLGLFEARALGRWQQPLWTGEPYPSEALTTVGLIVTVGVVVACIAAWRRRLALTDAGNDAWVFWVVVAGALTVMVFFGTPLLALAEQVPGLAHNRMNRARFLIPLGAVVIGALGLDSLLAHADGRQCRRTVGRRLAALTVVAGGAVSVWQAVQWVPAAERQGDLGPALRWMAVDLGVTVTAVVIAVAACRRRQLNAPAVLTLAALLWVQLVWPVREITPSAPVGDFYRPTAAHRALGNLLGDEYRFAGSGLFPYYSGSSQVHRLNDLRGFALRTRDARNLVLAAVPTAFDRDPLKVVAPAAEWTLASPVLDDLALRYFVLGSDEFPLGVVRETDSTIDRWVPSTEPDLNSERLHALGPVAGITVPLRAEGQCSAGRVSIELHRDGRVLGVASRPVYDVAGTFLPFAIDGQALAAGDAYGLTVRGPGNGCRVEVGVVDRPHGTAPARWEIAPDPRAPVRVVSAASGWVYERPTARPLVSSHARWRAFADQESLLDWLVRRPADEADVVGYVGARRPPNPGAVSEPAVEHVRWRPQAVELVARAGGRSLVSVAENADPGWSVRVDGRPAPVVRVDGALLGVFVDAGRHRVEFAYRQPVLLPSSMVSAFALSAVALGVLGPRLSGRRRRRTAVVPAMEVGDDTTAAPVMARPELRLPHPPDGPPTGRDR